MNSPSLSSEHLFAQLVLHNLKLPELSVPGGSYLSVNVRHKVAYVAIQFPILNGEYFYLGKLGENLDTMQGIKAMELCALNTISQMHHKVGLENVLGLNHVDMYYRGVDSWDEAPLVANGASDLFIKLLGEKGQHSRAIFGVQQLPRNFSVGLTSSWTLI
jgi:hypothetical protein